MGAAVFEPAVALAAAAEQAEVGAQVWEPTLAREAVAGAVAGGSVAGGEAVAREETAGAPREDRVAPRQHLRSANASTDGGPEPAPRRRQTNDGEPEQAAVGAAEAADVTVGIASPVLSLNLRASDADHG